MSQRARHGPYPPPNDKSKPRGTATHAHRDGIPPRRAFKKRFNWRPTKIMNMTDLMNDDDFISHLLIDKVGQTDVPIRTHKMNPDRMMWKVPEDRLIKIVRRLMTAKGPVQAAIDRAVRELLQQNGVLLFLQDYTDRQVNAFATHASRYFELYLPTGAIEISHTTRYTHFTGKSELCVLATRRLPAGVVISELKGSMATLTEEEEDSLQKKREFGQQPEGPTTSYTKRIRRDFSVIHSKSMKKNHLFLGPARFVNHDCFNNCELVREGKYITFRTNRIIEIGEEVTAHYGDDYFGKRNKNCLCATCERNQRGGYAPGYDQTEESDTEEEVEQMRGSEEQADGSHQASRPKLNERRTRRGVYAVLPEEESGDETDTSDEEDEEEAELHTQQVEVTTAIPIAVAVAVEPAGEEAGTPVSELTPMMSSVETSASCSPAASGLTPLTGSPVPMSRLAPAPLRRTTGNATSLSLSSMHSTPALSQSQLRTSISASSFSPVSGPSKLADVTRSQVSDLGSPLTHISISSSDNESDAKVPSPITPSSPLTHISISSASDRRGGSLVSTDSPLTVVSPASSHAPTPDFATGSPLTTASALSSPRLDADLSPLTVATSPRLAPSLRSVGSPLTAAPSTSSPAPSNKFEPVIRTRRQKAMTESTLSSPPSVDGTPMRAQEQQQQQQRDDLPPSSSSVYKTLADQAVTLTRVTSASASLLVKPSTRSGEKDALSSISAVAQSESDLRTLRPRSSMPDYAAMLRSNRKGKGREIEAAADVAGGRGLMSASTSASPAKVKMEEKEINLAPISDRVLRARPSLHGLSASVGGAGTPRTGAGTPNPSMEVGASPKKKKSTEPECMVCHKTVTTFIDVDGRVLLDPIFSNGKPKKNIKCPRCMRHFAIWGSDWPVRIPPEGVPFEVSTDDEYALPPPPPPKPKFLPAPKLQVKHTVSAPPPEQFKRPRGRPRKYPRLEDGTVLTKALQQKLGSQLAALRSVSAQTSPSRSEGLSTRRTVVPGMPNSISAPVGVPVHTFGQGRTQGQPRDGSGRFGIKPTTAGKFARKKMFMPTSSPLLSRAARAKKREKQRKDAEKDGKKRVREEDGVVERRSKRLRHRNPTAGDEGGEFDADGMEGDDDMTGDDEDNAPNDIGKLPFLRPSLLGQKWSSLGSKPNPSAYARMRWLTKQSSRSSQASSTALSSDISDTTSLASMPDTPADGEPLMGEVAPDSDATPRAKKRARAEEDYSDGEEGGDDARIVSPLPRRSRMPSMNLKPSPETFARQRQRLRGSDSDTPLSDPPSPRSGTKETDTTLLPPADVSTATDTAPESSVPPKPVFPLGRMHTPVRYKPRKWKFHYEGASSEEDEEDDDMSDSATPEKFNFNAANFSPGAFSRVKVGTNLASPPRTPIKSVSVSPLPRKAARRLRPTIPDLLLDSPGVASSLVNAGWESNSDTETPDP